MKINWEIVEEAIRAAQEIYGAGSGAQKKAYAVEFINKKIDIPYLPETIEAKLIDWAIEGFVWLFKRYNLWSK